MLPTWAIEYNHYYKAQVFESISSSNLLSIHNVMNCNENHHPADYLSDTEQRRLKQIATQLSTSKLNEKCLAVLFTFTLEWDLSFKYMILASLCLQKISTVEYIVQHSK